MRIEDLDLRPRVNTPDIDLPPRPRPDTPAHVIKSDAEAIAVARELAAEFAVEAALRDREGYLPLAEIDRFSQSGLWGITVPKAYGGVRASYVTITEVIKIISAADPSLGQMPHNHLSFVEHIANDGTEAQKDFFFREVLHGIRIGNAMSEVGTRTLSGKEFGTRIRPSGDGYIVTGKKFYSTGALLSHTIAVLGRLHEEGPTVHFAFVDRNAPGLTVVNDWSSFGQRTTVSGTVILDNVYVPASHVMVAQWRIPPNPLGAINQIILSAVDIGIATAAVADTIDFVRTMTRPWMDSGQASATEDLYTISAVGDLKIRLHAAETMLERAAHFIDAALLDPTEETVAEAQVATGEARVLSADIALLATNKLFELAGTRATLAAHGLDRHWRNARTHTLHDPIRWKYFHVGNYFLNGLKPPRGAFF